MGLFRFGTRKKFQPNQEDTYIFILFEKTKHIFTLVMVKVLNRTLKQDPQSI